MNQRRSAMGVVCMFALAISLCTFKTGCGGGLLGLEDYQRDLLFGGVAGALLLNQPAPAADGGAGAPVPGPAGEQGVPGQDGVDGVVGPAGPQGPQGPQGAAGEAGDPGSDGSNGSAGTQGSAGATLFDIFIDDFFTSHYNSAGDLTVSVVSIQEPTLGGQFFFRAGSEEFDDSYDEDMDELVGDSDESSVIAYRVAIPEGYKGINDVTMRLFLNRTGPVYADCAIISARAVRLRDGEGVEAYGSPIWLALENQDEQQVDSKLLESVLVNGYDNHLLVVVDIPINSPEGLDAVPALAAKDLMAFELQSETFDGGEYHILGVEFFESESAATVKGAVKVDPCIFGKGGVVFLCPLGDCNENEVDDACDLRFGESDDCNENSIPDECESLSSPCSEIEE